jgi:hypothetical protein
MWLKIVEWVGIVFNVHDLWERMETMKLTKNLGAITLAIWLILTGLIPLLGLQFRGLATLMAALAAVAGVLLLIGPIKLHKSLGVMVLAIWLILQGLVALLGFSFPGRGMLLALLAIAAGILILFAG